MAGWAPWPVWRVAESLAPTCIRSPGRPAPSESLYRLSYTGPRRRCTAWNRLGSEGCTLIFYFIRYMSWCVKNIFLFTMAQRPPVGQGLLIIEDSWSHSDTPHTVWLLWTSDRPVVQTSTCQHTTLTRDRHPCPRRDSNPQSPQTSGRRLTP